jgi:TonB-linked SusC/RagA family outer membrane protein
MKKEISCLLIAVMLPAWLLAQNTITGKVTDEKGSPLAGAGISLKNKTGGTTTNNSGTFSLQLPAGVTAILVSYVGYFDTELPVNKTTKEVTVKMLPANTKGDDVIVIGYGTQKKSDLTGAIGSVSADVIAKSGVNSIDQVLQGRVAGVQMTQNTGLPGGGSSIQIRGLSSINSTNEPIFVIDGVVISSSTGTYSANAFSSINPADIESIDVLKDASATAIYGAQGANGVIIVTTKKGKAGPPVISVETKFSVQELQKYLPVANLQEYAYHQNAYYGLKGWLISDLFANPALLGKGTNWQKEIFGPAAMQNYNFFLSGANANTSYKFSASYLNQGGVASGSGFQRFTVSSGLESKIKPWMTVGGTMNFNSNKQVVTIADYSLIGSAVRQSPSVPATNLDGSYGGPEDPNDAFVNPKALSELLDRGNRNIGLRGNVYLDLKPVSWISFRTEFAGAVGQDFTHSFEPTYTLGYVTNSQITNIQTQRFNANWTLRNLLNINKRFGKAHSLNALLGQEATLRTSNYLMGQRLGGSNQLHDLDGGDAITASNGGNTSRNSISSYFGRASYAYLNKYLLTATLRFDGTSNFSEGHKWGTFPSAAFAWKISEERFFKSIKNVNSLKLRLGYGKVGNSNIIPFAYTAMLANVPTIWGTGRSLANVPNPDVTWESTNSYNLGVDLAMFNSRIQLTADVYLKKTDNLLLALSLPSITGTQGQGSTTPPWGNVGSLQNKGLELSLSTVNISKKAFQWTSNFTFTLNKNKVLKLNTELAQIDRTYQGGGGTYIASRTKVGESIGMFYGYKAIGRINSSDDLYGADGKLKIAIPEKQTVSPSGIWVGDLIWEDYNTDGVINEKDRQLLGSPLPKFTYGIGNTFSYKGFDLSFFLYGVYGNKVLNFLNILIDNPNIASGNITRRAAVDYAHLSLKDPSGSTTDVKNVYVSSGDPSMPRMSTDDVNANSRLSSRFIESGSFLRLQSLNLAYSLPRSMVSRIGFNTIKVFVSGQNLFTITKYSGFDPEIGLTKDQYTTSGQNALLNGVDPGRYPNPRIYSCGLTFGL